MGKNMSLSDLKTPRGLLKNKELKCFLDNCDEGNGILKKLVKKIKENVNDKENFFNFLVELNLAKLFSEKNINFYYEKHPGVDFLLENKKIAISVKSLQEKKYRQCEKNLLAKRRIIKIKDPSGSEILLSSDDSGGYERNESGSVKRGSPPNSESKEKSKILENMAELESVQLPNYKKVLFLFGQSDEIDNGYVDDCCRWYFNKGLSRGDLFSFNNYVTFFKKNKDKNSIIKKNNISAIIYTDPYVLGIYSMVWYQNIDKIKMRIWPRSKNFANDIKSIFY